MMKGIMSCFVVLRGSTKGSMVVSNGNKTGTPYMTSNCTDMIDFFDSCSKSNLWNFRLGNMIEKGMNMIVLNKKILELKYVDL